MLSVRQGHPQSYQSLTSEVTIIVESGKTNTFEVAFPPVGYVTGVVTSASGFVEKADIRLSGEGDYGKVLLETETNSNGEFHITHVLVGHYEIEVDDPNTRGKVTQTVVIAEGEIVRKGIWLPDFIDLPTTLIDGKGFTWDIQPVGNIKDGTDNAFDGGLGFTIKGHSFYYHSTGIQSGEQGRNILIGPQTVYYLQVNRKIFVPEDDGFIRYLEILDNQGREAVEAKVRVKTNLGSNKATELVVTTDDDPAFTVADRGLITDDADGTGTPAVLHMFSGPNAAVDPGAFYTNIPGNDDLWFEFEVSVPPGERVILMHFAVQRKTRAEAREMTDRLRCPDAKVLAELGAEERSAIVNWFPFVDGDCGGVRDTQVGEGVSQEW